MNLMILKTDETTYEVDLEAKLIRANDGQWQSFIAISGLAQDEPAVIHWTEADEVAATITSPIRMVTSKENKPIEPRRITMPIIESNLEDILNDYDWGEVFGEGTGGNCTEETDACPPGAEMDLSPPKRADIARIIALVNGENDGPEWIGVFELKDGRFCVATGSCDYTGWDCQAGNSLQVARTLDDAIRYGLSEEQATRLGLDHPATELAPATEPEMDLTNAICIASVEYAVAT